MASGSATDDESEMIRALEGLVVACTEAELRDALLAAVPFRSAPSIAAELPEARLRLRALKQEAQAAAHAAAQAAAHAAASEAASTVAASCVICMDGVPTFTFVPCGHKHLCAACHATKLGGISTCPTCRLPFTSVIRVFD
jgi:hypothetical protein